MLPLAKPNRVGSLDCDLGLCWPFFAPGPGKEMDPAETTFTLSGLRSVLGEDEMRDLYELHV